MTDIQYSYWIGRQGVLSFGNCSTHIYMEFEGRLDPPRLVSAWRRVVAAHAMLRAEVLPQALLRISERAAPDAVVVDLSREDEENARKAVGAARARMTASPPNGGVWPMYEVIIFCMADRSTVVCINLDMIVVDAHSMAVLLAEWRTAYEGGDVATPSIGFEDVVTHQDLQKAEPEYLRAREYWKVRGPQLPAAPRLPLHPDITSRGRKPQFSHYLSRISSAEWSAFKRACAVARATPAGALAAAYAAIVGHWTRQGTFTLNLTVSRRPPIHPDVARVVGDFTSTVLLPVDVRGANPFAGRASHATSALWSALEHAAVSGVEVLRELSSSTGVPAFMPVVLTCNLDDCESATGWLGKLAFHATETSQVILDCRVQALAGGVEIGFDVAVSSLAPNVGRRMHDAFVGLVHRLAEDPLSWEAPPRIELPPSEAETRAASSNSVRRPFQRLGTRRCEDLDRPALIADERVVTHEELSVLGGDLARRLIEAGVERGEVVAVAVESRVQEAIAVYGILEAGAAYLPLAMDWPTARVEKVVRQAGVATVVVEDGMVVRDAFADCRIVAVETPGPGRTLLPARTVVADDVAYIIYTSGSSGDPKGVVVTHGAATNTIDDMNERFAMRSDDRIFAVSRLGFDLSVYDLFGVLRVGGAAVLCPPSDARHPDAWLERCRRDGVTVWNSVPALFEMFVAHLESRAPDELEGLMIRRVFLSGDWIPVELPERARRILGSQIAITSLGGATEAGIWSNFFDVEGPHDPLWPSVPYGRPLSNQQLWVLDDQLRPRPEWVPGDLYISGASLAKEYHHAPDLTARAFIEHPDFGVRMYRTGDLARIRDSGLIEFLGREDGQVKLRGHRVELGEVEAALRSLPEVSDAYVLLRHAWRDGPDRWTDRRGTGEPIDAARRPRGAAEHTFIVGYIVLSAGGASTSSPSVGDTATGPSASPISAGAAIRERMAALVPDYMIPNQVVVLDRIPLSSNGKVDRRAFPDPVDLSFRAETGRRELTATESEVCDVVSQLLGVRPEAVDVRASFFEIGGNSVLLVDCAQRLSARLGVEIPVVDLFRAPSVERLAALLESGGTSRVPPQASQGSGRRDALRRLRRR